MKIELIVSKTEQPFRLKRKLDEQARDDRNGSLTFSQSKENGYMAIINGITNGDMIVITLDDGNQKKFCVFIGDALLKGNSKAIWLKSDEEGKNIYLRKLPQKPLSVGVALFQSKTELENTLNSGEFYIA